MKIKESDINCFNNATTNYISLYILYNLSDNHMLARYTLLELTQASLMTTQNPRT